MNIESANLLNSLNYKENNINHGTLKTPSLEEIDFDERSKIDTLVEQILRETEKIDQHKNFNPKLFNHNNGKSEDKRLITIPKQKKSGAIKGSFNAIKSDITNPDDYFDDNEKQHRIATDSIDLIIGSGALTRNVLEGRKDALEAAKKCYQLLKPNGKMILAGYTNSLLCREDFESLGYKVINLTLAGSTNEAFSGDVNHYVFTLGEFNNQFYILEK